MKNLMTTLILTLTAFTALADLPEVKLDKNKIELATNQVVVVRTAATPEKVKFEMSVPITRTECLAYDTRQVYGPDSSCG